MSARPTDIIDESGRALSLGNMLGQGGEGAVWDIPARPELVAKIYHNPLSSDRAEKIRAMATLKTEALDKLTSWPAGLLTKKDCGPIGLLMPKVFGRKDIHHLYSPKSRRSDFPSADWRFLMRAAANVSRAFAAVHATGNVIGDVNHGSVLVATDATVKLIDCDSFQITHAGRRFLCEVGVETFTPPELQGKSFKGVVRTANQDNFGLAVLIFQLLFMGRHPFAGRYTGEGDMPISRAIAEIRFPYGSRHQAVGMLPPPGTPHLSMAGQDTALLFERAFAKETTSIGRPVALDWSSALGDLEQNLAQCRANSSHWHHKSSSCPWCPMEASTGITLFGLASSPGATPGTDIASIWRQIEGMVDPGAAPSIPIEPKSPSPEAKAVAGSRSTRNILVALTALAAMGLTLNFAAGLWWIFGPAAGFVAWKVFGSEEAAAKVRGGADSAIGQWNALNDIWQKRAGNGTFLQKQRELAATKREWDAISAERTRRLDQLKRNQRQLQLEAYLDKFEIANAKIESVGAGRKRTLESYGIETAWDVTNSALSRVPGFGPKTNQKLLRWRAGLEAKFVFQPNAAIDPQALLKVETAILKEKAALEAKLRQGVIELRQLATGVASARETLRGQLEAATAAKAQAEADLKTIGK